MSAMPINVGPHMQRIEEFILLSIVRGFYVHQPSWQAVVDKGLPWKTKVGNGLDYFAVAVQGGEQTFSVY